MPGLFTTIALALTITSGQSNGVLIRWKLKEGETFYAKTESKLEQTITAMGQNIDQKQEQTTVHRYKVLKASEQGYTIEQTILQSITESNVVPGGLGELDKKMKGATFTAELDKEFKVQKVTGVGKLVEKLSEENPMMKQLLAGILNDDIVKRSLEDLFRCGPDKPIQVDQSWKRDETIPLGPIGEMSMTMEHKLAKSMDGLEEITFTGDAKFSPPKQAAAGLPFTISKVNLKSDQLKGKMMFDSKIGRAKETTLEMKLAGSMTVKVGELELDMDLSQKMTTKSTLSDKNPVVD